MARSPNLIPKLGHEVAFIIMYSTMTLKSSGASAHRLLQPFTCTQLPWCSAFRSLRYFLGRPINSRIHQWDFLSTESNAAQKSTKTINAFRWNSSVFSTICRISKNLLDGWTVRHKSSLLWSPDFSNDILTSIQQDHWKQFSSDWQ